MSADSPKTWEYRGCVIEEDFESRADRAPQIFLSHRTGYMIRATNYTDKNLMYMPGKYRTIAEAMQRVDEVLKEEGK